MLGFIKKSGNARGIAKDRHKVNRVKSRTDAIDLVKTFVPISLISELTSKCNLRCSYCPKGDLNKEAWNTTPGRDLHMEDAAVERYIDSARIMGFKEIQLSGVGEFSFRPDWVKLGSRIRDASGAQITIISNFHRIFDVEELDFLLSLYHIMVSIDTPDANLLKKVRKAVDLKAITSNMINLRARAIETGRRMPLLKINGTIYAENLTHIHALACFAASAQVHIFQIARVGLSEANEFPHPITMGSPEDAVEALRQMDLAKEVCASAGVEYVEFGDLRSELARLSSQKPIAA